MANSTYLCAVAKCRAKLSEHARSAICPKCQNVARYWQHKDRGETVEDRLGKILLRQHSLSLWQSRMIYLGGVNKEYAKAKRDITRALST